MKLKECHISPTVRVNVLYHQTFDPDEDNIESHVKAVAGRFNGRCVGAIGEVADGWQVMVEFPGRGDAERFVNAMSR
jgi:hypothetical protein